MVWCHIPSIVWISRDYTVEWLRCPCTLASDSDLCRLSVTIFLLPLLKMQPSINNKGLKHINKKTSGLWTPFFSCFTLKKETFIYIKYIKRFVYINYKTVYEILKNYVFKCFVCMYVCVPCGYLVPEEAPRTGTGVMDGYELLCK